MTTSAAARRRLQLAAADLELLECLVRILAVSRECSGQFDWSVDCHFQPHTHTYTHTHDVWAAGEEEEDAAAAAGDACHLDEGGCGMVE